MWSSVVGCRNLNLRTGPQIVHMDIPDDLRMGQQGRCTPDLKIQRHLSALQFGAHCAINDDDFVPG